MTLLINNNTEAAKLVETLKNALLNGETVKMKLNGYSMWPAVKSETNAIIKRIDLKYLQIGDIIVFATPKKIIAHRIIKIDKNKCIITKGDSVFNSDGILNIDSYYGKVIKLELLSKTINLETVSKQRVNYFLALFSYLLTPLFKIGLKLRFR